MEDIIRKIEQIKADEYKLFGGTKETDKDLLLVQFAEHSGFQRACDYIINIVRSN